jgi:hypothetical protein
MKPFALLACLGLGLLLSGCGEQIAGEAQKALEQIKVEASKAAVKTLDDLRTDAVTRLKKAQGAEEEKDKPQEKTVKNEDAPVQK